jgi:hypothetical protein
VCEREKGKGKFYEKKRSFYLGDGSIYVGADFAVDDSLLQSTLPPIAMDLFPAIR